MNGKFIKHIPNILTVINMSSGICAILFLFQSEHPQKKLIASALIILGAFSDFFDGFFAQKFNVASAMGKQLDSFADIITFGVAPIILINYTMECVPIVFITIPSLIFIMAGAYRLARYNLNDFSKHFKGLPITVAGIVLTIYCIIYPLWGNYQCRNFNIAITAGFIILLSFLMISKKMGRIFF